MSTSPNASPDPLAWQRPPSPTHPRCEGCLRRKPRSSFEDKGGGRIGPLCRPCRRRALPASAKAVEQGRQTAARLAARYVFPEGVDPCEHIAGLIRATPRDPGHVRFVRRKSQRLSHFAVNLAGLIGAEQWVLVVYDRFRHRVAAVEPLAGAVHEGG